MAAKPQKAITASVIGSPEVTSVPLEKSSVPNETRHGFAQLWTLKHADDSSTTRCSMRMCHALAQMPIAANGTANHLTLRSRLMAATSRMTANEYMKMRWNQHHRHGTQCSPDSLKNRLPEVAVTATSAASGNCTRCIASRNRTLATLGITRAATISTAPAIAMIARTAAMSCSVVTVSYDIPPFCRAFPRMCWQDAAVIAPVVTPEIVSAHPRAVLADVRWYLDGRDGHAAFEQGHIPGAVWVDLDRQLAAQGRPDAEGRHPLPTPEDFAAAMSESGIGDDTVVVAYDDTGGLTAGRLVVMLRMLGRDSAVLDGGLESWLLAGFDLESGSGVPPTPATFTAQPWPADRFATADEAAALAAAGGAVLDARAHERFTGEQTLIDPRPGHIPGARSAPWSAVLGPDGRLLHPDQLRAHFAALDASGEASDAAGGPITYCGSGVSACINIIAMEHAGLTPPRLYVASWSGWSADQARPTELGDPWAASTTDD